MLTDTHCHLDFDWFEKDRQAVLDRAWNAGISRLLIPQVEFPLSKIAITLAESDPRIFLALGVHPNSANSWDQNTLSTLRSLASHPKVVAIGEIGLDYYRHHAAPELQREILLQQLELATQVNKPVILHCRDAYTDLFEILSEWVSAHDPTKSFDIPRYGVLHSFSGSVGEAQQAVQLGFYLGITGVITYKNAENLRQASHCVGLEHLLLETDAPFLTPVPNRGKRNEPSYVHYTNEYLANILAASPESTAKMTYNNAEKLFKW